MITGRENLIRQRENLSLTQSQMADRLGISLRYYQYLEKGERIGNYKIWDNLELMTGVHQTILREIFGNRPHKANSRS